MRYLLVVLLLLGVVAGFIASDKGHKFGTWFLIGALLGPIGVFWAGVTPPTIEWEVTRKRAVDALYKS